MPSRLGDRLGERAVAVVHVEIIIALEIVGDVDVGAAIVVEVARDHAESVAVDAVVEAGCVGNVGKVIAVIPEQTVACARGPGAALSLRLDGSLRVRRVIEQIHVEVAVSVVVEEQRLCRVADVLQSEFFGAVGEGAVAVIDVEDVATVHSEVVDARYVDVDLPVAIDVGHRDAGFPADRIGDAGLVGDVLELIVALIAIELVRAEVRGEVQVGEPVSVDIADGNSGTVVVVQVVEDVKVRPLRQVVGERDSGRFWLEELEQRRRDGWAIRLATSDGNRTKQGSILNELKTACYPLSVTRYPLPAARCPRRAEDVVTLLIAVRAQAACGRPPTRDVSTFQSGQREAEAGSGKREAGSR